MYRLDDRTGLVLTVDFFTPITDDPYEFGLVAAANSLSDVYAMGGRPLVALNVVGFPAALAAEMLGDVLRGGYDKAAEANCLIVGGHTVDDNEPKYGLSVVGLVEPGRQVTNAAAQPGDVLVLTKPLGTGNRRHGLQGGSGASGLRRDSCGDHGHAEPLRVGGHDGGRGKRLHRRYRLRPSWAT